MVWDLHTLSSLNFKNNVHGVTGLVKHYSKLWLEDKKSVPPKLDKSKIRLVIYADSDRGRTPYYDSNAISRVEDLDKSGHRSAPKPVRGKGTGCSAQKDPSVLQHKSAPKYHFQRLGSEVKVLEEMMFGNVGMAFKGSTLKVHLLRSPPQLMITKVFIPEKPRRESVGEAESDCSSLPGSSADFSSGEFPHLPLRKSAKEKHARSIPVDVPSRDLISDCSTDDDSGLASFTSSGSLRAGSFPSPSNSTASSYNSLHRRWMRAQTTALDGQHRKHGTDKSITSQGSVGRANRNKLAIAILFGSHDERDEDSNNLFQSFFFSHFALMEGHVERLRSVIQKAYFNHRSFLPATMEALEMFRNDVYDLYMAPRLPEPLWLTMMSTTTHRTRLCEKFMQEFTSLVAKYDNKNNKFFVSTLLSAVLTQHLAWVATVTPAGGTPSRTYLDKHSAKWVDTLAKTHPYNPLWAQLGDLFGAIGLPLKISRTVIVGKRADIVKKLLYILSYFIRCSDVHESSDPEHLSQLMTETNFDLPVSPSPSERTFSEGCGLPDHRTVSEGGTPHQSSSPHMVPLLGSQTSVTNGGGGRSAHCTNGGGHNGRGGGDPASSHTDCVCLKRSQSVPCACDRDQTCMKCLRGDPDTRSICGHCCSKSESVGRERTSGFPTNGLSNSQLAKASSSNVPCQEFSSIDLTDANNSHTAVPPQGFSSIDLDSGGSNKCLLSRMNANNSQQTFPTLDPTKFTEIDLSDANDSQTLPTSQRSDMSHEAMSELHIYAPHTSLTMCSLASSKVVESPSCERVLNVNRSPSHGAKSSSRDILSENKSGDDFSGPAGNLFSSHSQGEQPILRSQSFSDGKPKSRLAQQLEKEAADSAEAEAEAKSREKIENIRKMFLSEGSNSMFDEYFEPDIEAKINDDLPESDKAFCPSSLSSSKGDLRKDGDSGKSGTAGYESKNPVNRPSSLATKCRPITPTELSRRRHLSSTGSIDYEAFDPMIHCKEMKMPEYDSMMESGKWNIKAFDRNFGRSLLAGYTDHYMSDFVLHGTSDTNFKSRLLNDLQVTVQHSILDEPIEEAVCIIADTDNWTVEVASSRVLDISPSGCTTWTSSQLVADLIESVVEVWRLKMNAEFCLMHLEDRLQEIYFKSLMLSEYLRVTKVYNQRELTSMLGFETSDMPLLFAIAGTHTPSLALGAQ